MQLNTLNKRILPRKTHLGMGNARYATNVGFLRSRAIDTNDPALNMKCEMQATHAVLRT